MSHAEIWDDSALVDSWNDALEEYKQYHSLAARGEKVEDVLRKSEKQLNGLNKAASNEALDSLAAGMHVEQSRPEERAVQALEVHGLETGVEGARQPVANQVPTDRTTSRAPELPQHLIGQVHDEGLKNLLMAWYYAGYYTGLMEGKQQGTA